MTSRAWPWAGGSRGRDRCSAIEPLFRFHSTLQALHLAQNGKHAALRCSHLCDAKVGPLNRFRYCLDSPPPCPCRSAQNAPGNLTYVAHMCSTLRGKAVGRGVHTSDWQFIALAAEVTYKPGSGAGSAADASKGATFVCIDLLRDEEVCTHTMPYKPTQGSLTVALSAM
jgi:hypothetical protein